jgi:hypothetical protein
MAFIRHEFENEEEIRMKTKMTGIIVAIAAGAVASLSLAGCKTVGDHPHHEHPEKGEHPDHPEGAEHPEHPTTEEAE